MTRIERPTLSELRAKVQKDRHREIGNWLARRWARPTAVYGTWLAVRLGLTANQITGAAMAASLAGAVAIGSGKPTGFVLGVFLSYLAFWLDRVDGQLARWRGTSCLEGVYLDYLMHHAANLALGFALGYGLAARTGNLHWAVAGFAIGIGWALLALHNDCRYKAFFQRLKRESRSFRVDGGAGGRPAPPPPWPRSGLGVLTWPAAKACESHVVLIALALLAISALGFPEAWEKLWRTGVVGMSILAPGLALGRIVRTARRGKVETEFDRWFRTLECSAERSDPDLEWSVSEPTRIGENRQASCPQPSADRLSGWLERHDRKNRDPRSIR